MSEEVKGVRKALWTGISQRPLVGAAVAGWEQWVVDHPWTALAVAVIYEIFVISFIVIKKVCNGLEKKLVPILTEWAWVAILNFFSRFRRRYNGQVIYDHRVFNVRGLLTRGTYVLDVEKVFVELRIAPGYLQQAGVNPIGFKEVQGSQPIWEFLRRMKGKGLAALAIIGPPGSGKTTLLQHIALTWQPTNRAALSFVPIPPFSCSSAMLPGSSGRRPPAWRKWLKNTFPIPNVTPG